MRLLNQKSLFGALLALAIGLVGCGSEGAGVGAAEKGSLSVTVASLSAPGGKVDLSGATARVTLWAMEPVAGEENPREGTLIAESSDNLRWAATISDLLVGEYEVQAEVSVEEPEAAVFTTERVRITIRPNETATVTLVISVGKDPVEISAPSIVAIATDKAWVKPNGEVEVKVTVAGGMPDARFTASGVAWGNQGQRGGGQGWVGFTTSAEFTAGDSGTFVATAGPDAYQHGFLVDVRDADGNIAQMTLGLPILATGSAEFDVFFNFSPDYTGTLRVLNDYEGTWVWGTIDVTNVNDEEKGIRLSLAADESCVTAGANFAPGTSIGDGSTGGVASKEIDLGVLAAGQSATHNFLFRLPAACTGEQHTPGYHCDRAAPTSCELELQAFSDVLTGGILGGTTASGAATVTISTELVEPNASP